MANTRLSDLDAVVVLIPRGRTQTIMAAMLSVVGGQIPESEPAPEPEPENPGDIERQILAPVAHDLAGRVSMSLEPIPVIESFLDAHGGRPFERVALMVANGDGDLTERCIRALATVAMDRAVPARRARLRALLGVPGGMPDSDVREWVCGRYTLIERVDGGGEGAA